MITTVTSNDFVNAFRGTEYEHQFSYAALESLFSYYEELEESMGEQIELDVCAIACEWDEYNSLEDANEQYMLADREDHILNEDERFILASEHPDFDEEEDDPDDEVENPNFEPEHDDDALIEDIRNMLKNETTVIEFNSGVLVRVY